MPWVKPWKGGNSGGIVPINAATGRHYTGINVLILWSARDEHGYPSPQWMTSNLPFDEWTSVFGSERLTGALLDRLTHRVHILEMNGDSYRLNQSKRRSRRASAATPADNPTPDAWRKGPSYRPFLPASLMYFCFGKPMHFSSGVDRPLKQVLLR